MVPSGSRIKLRKAFEGGTPVTTGAKMLSSSTRGTACSSFGTGCGTAARLALCTAQPAMRQVHYSTERGGRLPRFPGAFCPCDRTIDFLLVLLVLHSAHDFCPPFVVGPL